MPRAKMVRASSILCIEMDTSETSVNTKLSTSEYDQFSIPSTAIILEDWRSSLSRQVLVHGLTLELKHEERRI